MLVSRPFVPVCVLFMYHDPGRMIATAVNKIRIKFSKYIHWMSLIKCVPSCQLFEDSWCLYLSLSSIIIIINRQLNPLVSGISFFFQLAHFASLVMITIFNSTITLTKQG